MKFLDFTEAPVGLLVKRSAHQRKELCLPADAADVLGIITDKEFFENFGRVVCYPVVHWEGRVASSTCHPINVTPVRSHALPVLTVDEAEREAKHEARAAQLKA